MFQAITDFTNDISAFNVPIPIELQIGIIIIIIIALCVGAYFLSDMFDISQMSGGFSWFIFIAVLNLSTLLAIFLYYNSKQGKYTGPEGKSGKKGKRGKKGTYVSCNFCKNNIYLQKVRKSDVICRLDTFTKDFKDIFDNENYFNDIINQGNNIDYDSFVNNILLNEITSSSSSSSSASSTSLAAVNKFTLLMNPKYIAVLLVKAINEITKASKKTYGTFRNPNGRVGYIALGDSVYGGLEDNMELNSFMIDGNILYPSNYIQLVSFKSYNDKTRDVDTYTIWRANGQTITETGFKGEKEQVHYSALGDICRFGTTQPKINECPTVSEKCLEEIDASNLILVYVYVGAIQIKNEKDIDYTQTESYLIENTPLNDIEIFSVWRTPMNTFLTNCNSQNSIVNNTFIFNIVNNLNSSLNKYGNISSNIKKQIGFLLEQIQIPNFLTSLILCKYYDLELIQDLKYYVNRYSSTIPEFTSIDISTAEIYDLMGLIRRTKENYEAYNEKLMKNANIKVNNKGIPDKVKGKVVPYDEKKEKHLPNIILKVYDTTITKLLTLPVQIENTNTLLDIVNLVFENGIETRIAVDSDGIAQGGVFLNSIQEMILRLCKVLMPPTTPAYTIKDECLGTFALDREREEVIKIMTEAKNIMYKLTEKLSEDYDKYQAILPNIQQYQTLMDNKMGQLCGHISNYNSKINSNNLEEFTTTRIKGLISLYNDMNNYLQDVMSKV